MRAVISQTEFPGLKLLGRGKVRDIYDLGDRLLIVATDRLSAFDVVLPTPIPDKGRVLTQLSLVLVRKIGRRRPASRDRGQEFHRRACSLRRLPCRARDARPPHGTSSHRMRRAGIHFRIGLEGLSEDGRHLRNCRFRLACANPIVCPSRSSRPRRKPRRATMKIFPLKKLLRASGFRSPNAFATPASRSTAAPPSTLLSAASSLPTRNLNSALRGDELIWIDEALTPDSSRFWPADQYSPGKAQPSFDKQFVRDYLEKIGWNKQPPAPALPPDVVSGTQEKYREAYQRVTGHALD